MGNCSSQSPQPRNTKKRPHRGHKAKSSKPSHRMDSQSKTNLSLSSRPATATRSETRRRIDDSFDSTPTQDGIRSLQPSSGTTTSPGATLSPQTSSLQSVTSFLSRQTSLQNGRARPMVNMTPSSMTRALCTIDNEIDMALSTEAADQCIHLSSHKRLAKAMKRVIVKNSIWDSIALSLETQRERISLQRAKIRQQMEQRQMVQYTDNNNNLNNIDDITTTTVLQSLTLDNKYGQKVPFMTPFKNNLYDPHAHDDGKYNDILDIPTIICTDDNNTGDNNTGDIITNTTATSMYSPPSIYRPLAGEELHTIRRTQRQSFLHIPNTLVSGDYTNDSPILDIHTLYAQQRQHLNAQAVIQANPNNPYLSRDKYNTYCNDYNIKRISILDKPQYNHLRQDYLWALTYTHHLSCELVPGWNIRHRVDDDGIQQPLDPQTVPIRPVYGYRSLRTLMAPPSAPSLSAQSSDMLSPPQPPLQPSPSSLSGMTSPPPPPLRTEMSTTPIHDRTNDKQMHVHISKCMRQTPHSGRRRQSYYGFDPVTGTITSNSSFMPGDTYQDYPDGHIPDIALVSPLTPDSELTMPWILELIEDFKHERILPLSSAIEIVRRAAATILPLPNVVELKVNKKTRHIVPSSHQQPLVIDQPSSRPWTHELSDTQGSNTYGHHNRHLSSHPTSSPQLDQMITTDGIYARQYHHDDDLLDINDDDSSDSSYITVDTTLAVVGDLHGQLDDLFTILSDYFPGPNQFMLFNGDFVDRGTKSCEIILILFALRALYPQFIHFNRGNHECLDMNADFQQEILSKYCMEFYNYINYVFCSLPIAHIVNVAGQRIFVVHGGLSYADITIADINACDRFYTSYDLNSILQDLLWSDPSPIMGRQVSHRGAGCRFGPDVVARFFTQNDIDLIIRAHEVEENGFALHFDNRLYTIFSASQYCGESTNYGSICLLNSSNPSPQIRVYMAKPMIKAYSTRRLERNQGILCKLLVQIKNNIGAIRKTLLEYSDNRGTPGYVPLFMWSAVLSLILSLDVPFINIASKIGVNVDPSGTRIVIHEIEPVFRAPPPERPISPRRSAMIRRNSISDNSKPKSTSRRNSLSTASYKETPVSTPSHTPSPSTSSSSRHDSSSVVDTDKLDSASSSSLSLKADMAEKKDDDYIIRPPRPLEPHMLQESVVVMKQGRLLVNINKWCALYYAKPQYTGSTGLRHAISSLLYDCGTSSFSSGNIDLLFSYLDCNNDGRITMNDFMDRLALLIDHFPSEYNVSYLRQDLAELIQEIDLDQDGDIDYNEFFHAFAYGTIPIIDRELL